MDESTNRGAANIMRLALFTGMRRGELFRLRWNHVDFRNGIITLVDTKSGRDRRIPMNDAARDLLQRLPRTSELVFPSRNGRQRTDIRKAVDKIKKAAGLPSDFRPLHGLRHIYASTLASSGKVDLYTLRSPKPSTRSTSARAATCTNGIGQPWACVRP